MFVEIQGRTYKITFSRVGRITFAELVLVDDKKGFVRTEMQAIANTDSRDVFVKSLGRKHALANLLDKMATLPEFEVTKEWRLGVWNQYFQQHPKDK